MLLGDIEPVAPAKARLKPAKNGEVTTELWDIINSANNYWLNTT